MSDPTVPYGRTAESCSNGDMDDATAWGADVSSWPGAGRPLPCRTCPALHDAEDPAHADLEKAGKAESGWRPCRLKAQAGQGDRPAGSARHGRAALPLLLRVRRRPRTR